MKKQGQETQERFRGVNKLCQSCINKCKQFASVVVVSCPNYVSRKKVAQNANKKEKSKISSNSLK